MGSSFILLVMASAAFTVAAGQILSIDGGVRGEVGGDISVTAASAATYNTVRLTRASTAASDTNTQTRSPTLAPTAPTPAPTTDCCACKNHPNNTWSNPECCIHGDNANTCATLRWQQTDGAAGTIGSCVWDPPPADDCAPTVAPTTTPDPTHRPTPAPITIASQTRSPTLAPTVPCEGSVVLQQADVEEPGFTFSPTSGPGVWFERCEDSPRCFRRQECNGGGDDTTTTAASTAATVPPAQCSTFRAIDMANLPSLPISSGAMLVNYSNTNWGSQTFSIQNTGTSNGCSFIPAGAERGFASHLGHAILTFSQPVTWFYIVTLHQQTGDEITTPNGVVTPQGCTHSSWGQYFKVTLTSPATQVELYDLGTGGGSGVSVMLAECNDLVDPSTGATATSQPSVLGWQAPSSSLWDACKRTERCHGGDPDLGRRCIKATPCNGSETGSPTAAERTRTPTPAPSSQTGSDTQSPTAAAPTARSPTVAPTAPCEDTIVLVPADVEERGIMLVPTTGPGVWFEKCEESPRCFRERRCNTDRPAVALATRSQANLIENNAWVTADVYENITADELQLPQRSRFRYCQRPVRCLGGMDSTGSLNQRCLKRLPCNGTGVEDTRPPTTAPTAQVIDSRPPTPSPTLLTGNTKPPTSSPTAPCEDSVALIPADVDEPGVIYLPTTGPGVWFERCEGSPRCFRQRRCNGHLVANANRTLISDDQQLPEGSLFRFCQHERRCHGNQHDALDDAVSRRRCIKQVPCVELSTPSPTQDHSHTRSPTRGQDRTSSPTPDTVSYETRAPTVSPTAPCEDTVTMVPTEVAEPGFRYEPTNIRGVWFDRCEGSPDCFERKRCSADANLPATSLFRTCQAEIRCEGQVGDVLRGCQCMKHIPCNDQINEQTRSPAPSPTWKPTPPIIIAGGDGMLATMLPPRHIATISFALDYAAVDKTVFATAVLDTLNRPPYSIPSRAVEEVNVHEGSVVVVLTLTSGTDGAAITSSTDFSVNFDGTTVNATSVEFCEDCDSSSSSAFGASGSGNDDSASSSDVATVAACVLGAALVVVVAVAIFAVRQKRNAAKDAALFDPEMARDPMGRKGVDEQVIYDAAGSGTTHNVEPNGIVVQEDRTSVLIQSVRRANPTRAADNAMYASIDAVGAAGLTESVES